MLEAQVSWPQLGQGFGLSLGLIVAIGAQNVFVLTQGARGHRPWLVAGVCTVCDGLLIGAGVGGVGRAASQAPLASGLLGLAGVLFLAIYGLRALNNALRGASLGLDTEVEAAPLGAILLTALGVSLLNPHALLDTVVLIGGLSSRLDATGRLSFGLGAVLASGCWFFALSLGGRLLAPVLRRPMAWRVLDALVCLTMWTLAAGLGRDLLNSSGWLDAGL
ncbi:MAG: amino acid transporter [Deltaproteobacteria bacterium HGW-Deltaproteobacteria-8]|jgi:L-lysine exporter family protein LysE/ArgO|nr:MAG: amino acid transporter [Deltaproteobacteria bacterium HGW-Deltaproteobacteria-8]